MATKIEEFESICKKLDDAGNEPSESAVITRLIDSLPSKFSAFKMAWESTSKTERKKGNLIARIIREGKRLKSTEEEETTLALKVKNMKMESSKSKEPFELQNKNKNSKNELADFKNIHAAIVIRKVISIASVAFVFQTKKTRKVVTNLIRKMLWKLCHLSL